MKKKSKPRKVSKKPKIRIALIVSKFNPEVTEGLRAGALAVLSEFGIEDVVQFSAPGAFELPLLAKMVIQTQKVSGVICLGCVIKGDTAHFEFISLGTAVGIQQVALEMECPVSFGVLTTYTDEQALVRSRSDSHNKGREAALAVIESILIRRQMAEKN